MIKEDNKTLPKEYHSTSMIESKIKGIDKFPEKEFKIMVIKLLKNTEKEIHKLKTSMHDIAEKCCQEIKRLKGDETEILQMRIQYVR